MKRFFRLLFCVAVALSVVACARHKIIPDDKLARIFHDAFLTNAYIEAENTHIDSLKIYEPIFEKYGYTTADVQYTIGNFSKRKSARLGDVVEQAIALLEEEGLYYDHEVAILDTVDNAARKHLTQVIRSDSMIHVRSVRDTSRVNFTLPVKKGEYTVSYRYSIDSLDRNDLGLRSVMWVLRDTLRSDLYSMMLNRNRTPESFSHRFTVDSLGRKLHVSLLSYNGEPKETSVTFRDLKVEYTPPTAQAVKELYEQQMNLRIFADEFIRGAGVKAEPTAEKAEKPKKPEKQAAKPASNATRKP